MHEPDGHINHNRNLNQMYVQKTNLFKKQLTIINHHKKYTNSVSK